MAGTLPDTIGTLRTAAPERYAEAASLVGAGHLGGAVYLFGYVAELVLKAAVFAHLGMSATDVIDPKTRDAIEGMMKQDAMKPRGPHDILRWAEWLVFSRLDLTGSPYPLAFSNDLRYHASAIDAEWSPSLRYHRVSVPLATATSVQTSALPSHLRPQLPFKLPPSGF